MPDIDPITREALRRAARMHNNAPQNRNRRPEPEHTPPPQEARHSEPERSEPPAHVTPPAVDTGHTEHEHRPSVTEHNKPREHESSHSPLNGILNSLFSNKDQSIILLLIILLMGEDGSPSLLLALLYLLI